MLTRQPLRFLLADDPGAGKTIMAGLVKELIARGDLERCLVVCPGSLAEQWERLERLKELSGLSWGEFAERLSVTQRGLPKWRNGWSPSGAYLWAVIELAREVPAATT